MPNNFQYIFDILNRHDNHIIIVAVYLLFALILAALRIAAHLHFRLAVVSFHLVGSKFKTKSDIEKIKHRILKKACAQYILTAERAVTRISTSKIVEIEVNKMSLAGWKYTALLPFIESSEIGVLGIGLVLAVIFGEYSAVYGLLAIVLFAALRILHAFFNVSAARKQLIDETIIFIERELGRFYANDAGSALSRLKNELTAAISGLADGLTASVNGLADELRPISSLVEAFGEINDGLHKIPQAFDEIKDGLHKVAEQSKFIESNQKALEMSLASYEASLQALAGSIGDGLGAFINLHAQTSAQTINDALRGNIERIGNHSCLS